MDVNIGNIPTTLELETIISKKIVWWECWCWNFLGQEKQHSVFFIGDSFITWIQLLQSFKIVIKLHAPKASLKLSTIITFEWQDLFSSVTPQLFVLFSWSKNMVAFFCWKHYCHFFKRQLLIKGKRGGNH
jgi:hypothetical protein